MDIVDIETILMLIDECDIDVAFVAASDTDGERRLQLMNDALSSIRAIALSNVPEEWRKVNYARLVIK